MAQVHRMRRKFQRNICPYDDTISLLKGGLQNAPRWLNSVRKYPPEQTWLTPGKLARPSEFFSDKIRNLILNNSRRPDWIPSLQSLSFSGSTLFNMSGAILNDVFDQASSNDNPDVEFAACQAWFMEKKKMSEEEAYEQAKFRMRDMLKQKKRIWEVYRRKQLLNKQEAAKEHENTSNEWIDSMKKEVVKTLHLQSLRKQSLALENRQQSYKYNSKTAALRNELKNTTNPERKQEIQHVIDQLETAIPQQEQKIRDEETKFNQEWTDNIKLIRFIEYSDYIANNPKLGLKDPTNLLLGIPNNVQNKNGKDIKRLLLLQMARKDHRLKYLAKNNQQQQPQHQISN